MTLKHPLMKNNIEKRDLNILINYLKKKDPKLTNGPKVKQFEEAWSNWLGVKYSVFVNSGSSANLLSISLLKIMYPKGGEIIVPPLTWSSDISSILFNGFKPVFVDINLENLSMNIDKIISKVNKKTIAVFITHVLGFNSLNDKLIKYLKRKKIHLIEDVCESHGAKFKNKKLGTYGIMSNFSFYYAHHMTTIEGGMICTNNKNIYNQLRMLRSHGMLRECEDTIMIEKYYKKYSDLNKDFIFTYPGFNVRNTEIGGILGLSQLKRLDKNIEKRNYNFNFFLDNLDKKKFFTNFDLKGSSNYAFILVLKSPNKILFNKILKNLSKNKIEFRVGTAGGGNQLRQPFLKKFNNFSKKNYINVEHIHQFGIYIGNFPSLSTKIIKKICDIVNS
tara:strand:+ start:7804 stop:8973 length:1170 start_codon:yes stop_codon:yes gene_type:complete